MAQKVRLKLEGLHCANCAQKIEKGVADLEGVQKASLNFSTKTLQLESDRGSREELVSDIRDLVERVEPDVLVSFFDEHEQASLKPADSNRTRLVLILIAGALFGLAFVSPFEQLTLPLYLASFAVVGFETVLKAVKNIFRGQIFDENFLMTVATIGAFAIGESPEGAAVMLFYQIGEFFQEMAVNRSRRSIADLLDIRPDSANLKTANGIKTVSPADVSVGDTIVVRPGEKIPLDGRVTAGSSSLDTSALTGESLPREVQAGEEVLSGSLNIRGLLEISVTKPFSESTVTKILALVEEAGSRKAPAEQFITKFARYYTPAVVLIAVFIALLPPLFFGGSFAEYINRALVFLVVSCPCALVISIPLTFFGGIGASSKNGILVKGGSFLEALPDVDAVVFDKTGTLTEGKFEVSAIYPANGVDERELLRLAAYAEYHSSHPIAKSVVSAFGQEVFAEKIQRYTEHAGYGVEVQLEGATVLAGSYRLMAENGITAEQTDSEGTAVYLAESGRYVGRLVIADRIKSDSAKAVRELHRAGVSRVVMLTGDSEPSAARVARELQLDEYHAGLLPHQKVERVEALYGTLKKRRKLLFVGDGINDAPSLARADIGVAMGGVGSDAAVEAADIVIMNDEPSKLPEAMKIARKTRVIVWQNIVFALGIKAAILALGAFGFATMWEAVFADVGVALLAILNAIRIAGYKK